MSPGGLANFNPIAHGGDFQRGAGAGGNYQQYAGSQSMLSSLPQVSDPEKAYANMAKQDYQDYQTLFSGFEKDLIDKAQTDTGLIDAAREDAATQTEIAAGIQQRNLERYGTDLTPAQRQEMERANQRGGQTRMAGGLNDARIMQQEANRRLLSDMINIGQGVNRSSMAQMQSAAGDAAQRKVAYEQAKSQHKQQTYGTIASLGTMAIMAMAI